MRISDWSSDVCSSDLTWQTHSQTSTAPSVTLLFQAVPPLATFLGCTVSRRSRQRPTRPLALASRVAAWMTARPPIRRPWLAGVLVVQALVAVAVVLLVERTLAYRDRGRPGLARKQTTCSACGSAEARRASLGGL